MTTLADLVDPEKDAEFPTDVIGLRLAEPPPPKAIENLRTLQKLGILSAEAIFGLIAQAPIDPINLAASLMRMMPGGWVFSPMDFTLIRTLSRNAKKEIEAGIRVDLISGDSIMALARDKKGRLVEFRTLKIEPGTNQLEAIQRLCADAIAAGRRETQG